MSSGAFANAAANQQGGFNAQDQSFAAQLLGQLFPQVAGALQGQQSLGVQLANLLKMNQSSSQQWAPQSSGGGSSGSGLSSSSGFTPMQNFNPSPSGGNGSNSWAAQDQQYLQNNPAPTYDPNAWMSGATYIGANGDFVGPGGDPTVNSWYDNSSDPGNEYY